MYLYEHILCIELISGGAFYADVEDINKLRENWELAAIEYNFI